MKIAENKHKRRFASGDTKEVLAEGKAACVEILLTILLNLKT